MATTTTQPTTWVPRLLAAAAAVVLVALVAPVPSARAQAPAGIEAELGFGGIVPDAPLVPLQVRLRPDRAVAGRLLVAVRGEAGRTVERRRVEVPAGGEQVHLFLVPRGVDARVQLVRDGADAAGAIRPDVDRTSRTVVGLLTDGPTRLPGDVTTPVTGRPADEVVIDPQWLDLGAEVLAGVGTVVVAQTDLTALSDTRRAALDRAVVSGLQLVVSDVRDGDLGLAATPVVDVTGLAAVPGGWSTTADLLDAGDGRGDPHVAVVAHGRGELVAVDDDVTERSALLGAVLRERDARSVVRARDLGPSSGQAVLDATTGGITGLPPIWALALGMAAYVLLVGPVNALVLRLVGRTQLAWVTVPAITVVVVLGAAGLARGGGGDVTARQLHAAWWLDDVGTQTSHVALSSLTRGERRLSVPADGWAVAPLGFDTGTVVERTGEGLTATLQLNARQAAGVQLTRGLDATPPLDVEAAVVDDRLRLEVTNLLEVALTDVVVRVAGVDVELAPSLDGGETLVEDVELPEGLPRVRPFVPFAPVDFGMQHGPREPASTRDVLVDDGVLPVLDPLPGVVWVLADGPAVPVGVVPAEVPGAHADEDSALVAVGVTPTPTSAGTSPFEVGLRVLDTSEGLGLQPPTQMFFDRSLVVAFDLPREGELVGVEHRLATGALAVDCVAERIEPDGTVTTFPCDGGNGEADAPAPMPMPPPLECPPDAISCTSGPGFMEACFEDGTCEATEFVEPFPVQGPAARLEVWDPTVRGWVEVADDVTLDPTYVDPLGRLVVRFTDVFDLDLSGRGVSGSLR